MPDILIRGIKKPERCFICPLKYNRGMNYYCKIKEMQGVDSCISKNTMSVVCPFSELPPHGDLIDRDQLDKTLDYYIREAGWGDEINKALGWVRDDFIKGEAVIVPASEEEDANG